MDNSDGARRNIFSDKIGYRSVVSKTEVLKYSIYFALLVHHHEYREQPREFTLDHTNSVNLLSYYQFIGHNFDMIISIRQ